MLGINETELPHKLLLINRQVLKILAKHSSADT